MSTPLIHEIMRHRALTIDVDDRISRARTLMAEHAIHHLPVLEGGRLVGMLSATDIIGLGYGDELEEGVGLEDIIDRQHPIAEVMTPEPVTIPAGSTIKQAAAQLGRGDMHALPVVNEDGTLAGLLTSTDLIRCLGERLDD